MGETSNGMEASTSKEAVINGKITCHLVRLPQIVLTRIDESQFPLPKLMSASMKKPLKRLKTNKNKLSPVSKTSVKKSTTTNKTRGRPKKEVSLNYKGTKLSKKLTNNYVESTSKLSLSKSPKNEMLKPQNSIVKNMLKKTMLQKRSKIVIPATKKPKALIKNKQSKPTSPKPKKIVPKITFDLPKESIDLDTSEDEFLYDELIEELENTKRRTGSTEPVVEKTTNIILKPNVGNKPPTVVRGGIIKRENLPADLKPIATSDTFYKSKETKNEFTYTKKYITEQRPTSTKSPNSLLDGSTSDKTSLPWQRSSPPKESTITTPSKKKREKTIKSNAVGTKTNKLSTSCPPPKKLKLNSPLIQTKPSTNPKVSDLEPISLNTPKPKIGPKMTAKVVPLSKSISQEDNLSDEYTEEETLENIDSDLDLTTKDVDVPMKEDKISQVASLIPNVQSQTKSCDNQHDDEDPHLDLLRILTDESDEPMPLETIEHREINTENNNDSSSGTSKTRDVIDTNSASELANTAQSHGSSATSNETDEEPKVRTIYDLMSEISLHYPSWNLHIIPETNAFCIAQVTKGRLGLPTLKKCIELDPVSYIAKVYIHQYHIKRFDGVYDSEESIIALIQEINSIKA